MDDLRRAESYTWYAPRRRAMCRTALLFEFEWMAQLPGSRARREDARERHSI